MRLDEVEPFKEPAKPASNERHASKGNYETRGAGFQNEDVQAVKSLEYLRPQDLVVCNLTGRVFEIARRDPPMRQDGLEKLTSELK